MKPSRCKFFFSLHKLCLLIEVWKTAEVLSSPMSHWSNSPLVLRFASPMIHWPTSHQSHTALRPSGPTRKIYLAYFQLVLRSTGPTIHCPLPHWLDHPFVLQIECVPHFGPTKHWHYALIYSLLRQCRHKMLHSISFLVPGTQWIKWTNEGDRKKRSKWSYDISVLRFWAKMLHNSCESQH